MGLKSFFFREKGDSSKNHKMSDFFTLEEREFIQKDFSKSPAYGGAEYKNAAADIMYKAKIDGKVDIKFLELICAFFDMKLSECIMLDRVPDRDWIIYASSIRKKIDEAKEKFEK